MKSGEFKIQTPAASASEIALFPAGAWTLEWARRVSRVIIRVPWLAGEIALAVMRYGFGRIQSRYNSPALARARWLQQVSRRMLRVFGVEVTVHGDLPASGLVVGNHLSYLDILVMASVTPAVFVAKADVSAWPVLGRLARLAGTVFVRRERRVDVARVNREIQAAVAAGLPVVLFPEGTSSDGASVLPFKSSLLEAGIAQEVTLSVACLRYALPDGDAAEEVCYWRDMTLVPHLLNLLSRASVTATIAFDRFQGERAGRKKLAHQLRAEVLRLQQTTASTHITLYDHGN